MMSPQPPQQIIAHRLDGVRQLDSPNQDARPIDDIELIVIHGISLPAGSFGGDAVCDLFTNCLDTAAPELADLTGVRVSSHLFVRRTGEVIQFVPFDRRAWHAGASSFRGRAQCNDYSVGIELEGTDTAPYEEVQYEVLSAICAALMVEYRTLEITGHSDIAPGRKTDPGPSFDWTRLKRKLAARL